MKSSSDEWVESVEIEEHIVALKRLPLTLDELLHGQLIMSILHDRVKLWRVCFADEMMFYIRFAENTATLHRPEKNVLCCFRSLEHFQRASDDYSRVVPRLKGRDKDDVFA